MEAVEIRSRGGDEHSALIGSRCDTTGLEALLRRGTRLAKCSSTQKTPGLGALSKFRQVSHEPKDRSGKEASPRILRRPVSSGGTKSRA